MGFAKEVEKLLNVTKNVIATGQHTTKCMSYRFALWHSHLFATMCQLCLDLVSKLNVFHFKLLEFLGIFIFMHYGVKISVILKLYQTADQEW